MRRLLLAIGCWGLAVIAAEAQIRGNYKGRLAGPEPGAQVDRAPRERGPRGRAFPLGRTVLPWWGGGWGQPTERPERAEAKEAPKEDKLKDLVVSPVYEKPKVNPKLIEIP